MNAVVDSHTGSHLADGRLNRIARYSVADRADALLAMSFWQRMAVQDSDWAILWPVRCLRGSGVFRCNGCSAQLLGTEQRAGTAERLLRLRHEAWVEWRTGGAR